MADADRIERWRQRMRDEGKAPLSLWLSHETKKRLEDMAAVWHCSPSELVEQALAQFHPGTPPVPGTVPDTQQLQDMLADAAKALLPTLKDEILAALQPVPAPRLAVRDTNRNVTDTHPIKAPPSTVRAHAYESAPAHSLITEPAPMGKGGRPRSPEGQQILDLLATHHEGLSAEEMRFYLKPVKALGDTLAGMRRTGVLTTEGEGKGQRYKLATVRARTRAD